MHGVYPNFYLTSLYTLNPSTHPKIYWEPYMAQNTGPRNTVDLHTTSEIPKLGLIWLTYEVLVVQYTSPEW